jgi:uncharacterized membrane protein
MHDAQGVLVGQRWDGQGYRQALWWVRYPTAPTAEDAEAARAAAAELADRLSHETHLAGWRFVVRDEPEQHRVTVIGTAPR